MTAILWFLLVGVLLVLLAVSGSFLKRIPLSTGVLYLLVGVGVGPAGLDLFNVDPVEQAALLERITEVAVIVSLFSAGLKLRSPLTDSRWIIPFRLASLSMVITVALIALERQATGGHRPPPDVVAAGNTEDHATDHDSAPAYMAQAVLGFSEQLERILTVAVVVLLGGMLAQTYISERALWFVPLFIFIIRPFAAWIGLLGTGADASQQRMIGWFGVRGVGSVYYLTFAIHKGLPTDLAEPLTALMLATIVTSIVLHGVTVTPLMRRYQRTHRTWP